MRNTGPLLTSLPLYGQLYSSKVTSMTGGNILFTCRDLKRDVAKKLEKLEKRTQKAIVELIREYQDIVGVYLRTLIDLFSHNITL